MARCSEGGDGPSLVPRYRDHGFEFKDGELVVQMRGDVEYRAEGLDRRLPGQAGIEVTACSATGDLGGEAFANQ